MTTIERLSSLHALNILHDRLCRAETRARRQGLHGMAKRIGRTLDRVQAHMDALETLLIQEEPGPPEPGFSRS